MSCLSDIDLATLHEIRLEEKFNYKLSNAGINSKNNHNNHNLNNGDFKRNLNRYNRYNTNKCNFQQYNHQQHSDKLNYDNNNYLNFNKNNIMNKIINQSNNNNNTNHNNINQLENNINQLQQQQQQQQQLQSNQYNNNNYNYSEKFNTYSKNKKTIYNCDILNKRLEKIKITADNYKISDDFNCNCSKPQKRNLNDNISSDLKIIEEHNDDCVYFSTATRRRRSGTWPRTRSLNAPSPFQQFGPCGRIMKNQAMVMQIQDPASQRLTWYKPPLTVLVIKKVRDSTVLPPFVKLVKWLVQEKRMVVWVEAAVLDDPLLQADLKFQTIKDKLVTFKDGRDDLTDRIDFIICLGGDGTLLYASLLFQQSVPPVMAFHLGSLGFLTPFRFDNFEEQVTNVLEGHAALTLRSRLRCIIVRKSNCKELNSSGIGTSTNNLSTENSDNFHYSNSRENDLASSYLQDALVSVNKTKRNTKDEANILVLNEVVVDRGPSPFLSNIDLYLDGKYITSVQGDGLIISTPTGSTAYAVAAGASMIHPSVPAILLTPICPHSLSFRPIVVPAGVELKVQISPDSRNTSWVSFDGRNRQELFHGDSLRVTTSIYPVPSICAQDQIADWFDSLAGCLHWNVRKRQKHLDELSDLTGSGSEDTLDELDKASDILLDS